jgi:pimeloyl-ACP methyl ester carboxylesterase
MLRGLFTRRYFVSCLGGTAAGRRATAAVKNNSFRAERPLVAHDASGPPAIDWALAHPDRVAGLVLLNTYYCEMPTLRPPEAIWLFSTPPEVQDHGTAVAPQSL